MTISMPISKPARAAAAVCLSGAMWGLWWIPVRGLARHGIEGDWISVAVYAMASLLLAPFALARLRKRRDASIGLAPIWATLIDVFVLKERLVARRLVTVACGLGGAAVVLGGGHAGIALPLPRSLGDWMGLAAGMAFAMGSLFLRKAETTASSNDPLIQSFMSFMVGWIVGCAFLGLFPSGPTPAGPAWAAAPLAVVVVIAWLLPQMWLFMWGAARLAPGRVAILMLVEPMAAVVSAALLLDEPLGVRELAGSALIVLAAALEALPSRRPVAAR